MLPRAARSLIAMAGTFGVLWAGLYLGMSAFLALLFGVAWALLLLAVVLAGMIAAVAAIARWATGHRSLGAGVTIAMLAVVLQGVAMAHFRTIPMIWVGPGLELVSPLVALGSALVLGVFLGPLWLRIVSALAAAAVTVVATAAIVAEPPADAPSYEEPFELFREARKDALVSDALGSTVVRVELPWGALALLRTDTGGLVEVGQNPPPSDGEAVDVYQCGLIAPTELGRTSEDRIEDYAQWCVADGDGWARADGLGEVHLVNGDYVAVRSADPFYVELAGAPRAATAAEVGAVADSLRPITEDELETAFENQRLPADAG